MRFPQNFQLESRLRTSFITISPKEMEPFWVCQMGTCLFDETDGDLRVC